MTDENQLSFSCLGSSLKFVRRLKKYRLAKVMNLGLFLEVFFVIVVLFQFINIKMLKCQILELPF